MTSEHRIQLLTAVAEASNAALDAALDIDDAKSPERAARATDSMRTFAASASVLLKGFLGELDAEDAQRLAHLGGDDVPPTQPARAIGGGR